MVVLLGNDDLNNIDFTGFWVHPNNKEERKKGYYKDKAKLTGLL